MGVALPLAENLRQMLALLEGERQALAALDLERIVVCSDGKLQMCNALEARGAELDEECRTLLDAVKRMNEVNRKLRNLLAANVQSRLSALMGDGPVYAPARSLPALRELPR
jgi:hypothetical protein